MLLIIYKVDGLFQAALLSEAWNPSMVRNIEMRLHKKARLRGLLTFETNFLQLLFLRSRR